MKKSRFLLLQFQSGFGDGKRRGNNVDSSADCSDKKHTS